jgi:osmotically-inducible protein OsmY
MENATLQLAVKSELMLDPKVDASEIAVSADAGVVTLQGTVGSLRQKIEAGRDAKNVYGVYDVDNRLQVRILLDDRKDDAQLRGTVLQALRLDSLIPSTIDAKVEDGYVTLTGSANWQYERAEAETVASNVPGVTGVRSEIVLETTAGAADIDQTITQEFQRLADVDADKLSVQTTGGTVTLSGTVPSWSAHDAAVNAAWMAPGVTDVEDRIEVRY